MRNPLFLVSCCVFGSCCFLSLPFILVGVGGVNLLCVLVVWPLSRPTEYNHRGSAQRRAAQPQASQRGPALEETRADARSNRPQAQPEQTKTNQHNTQTTRLFSLHLYILYILTTDLTQPTTRQAQERARTAQVTAAGPSQGGAAAAGTATPARGSGESQALPQTASRQRIGPEGSVWSL